MVMAICAVMSMSLTGLLAVRSQRRATARMTSPSSTGPHTVAHAVEGVVEQHMCSSSSGEEKK